MFELRDYQHQLKNDVYTAWDSGRTNVIMQSATGSGKTVTFCDILREQKTPSVVTAHRSEIVSQISLALAEQQVPHNIIATDSLVKYIQRLHEQKAGRIWFNGNAKTTVGSVQTLTSKKRINTLGQWAKQQRLWVQDEGHHVLANNIFGKAHDLFVNARGLLPTATPCRADGKGLGRHADGVADTIVEGPDMRWLIDQGNLTDYRIFAPPTEIDFDSMKIGTTGDYTDESMKLAIRKSTIVGDVVTQYMRLAMGKLCVVFATDVETASDFVAQFNFMGVPAALVNAKTPERLRRETIARFERRALLVLVNVDLFGEGFALPAIEVVSMARPTQSFALYSQQFGRGLRPMPSIGKTHALIIDHVGNVIKHNVPDAGRSWTLDRRDKKARAAIDPDLIPMRTCGSCLACYEAIFKQCPYCSHINVPEDRSKPEFVDGDLTELEPATLERLRGIIAKKDTPPDVIAKRMERDHCSTGAIINVVKNIQEAQNAQAILRYQIGLWSGLQRALGRDDSESYKRFYWKFGVDVMSAQAFGRADAVKLTEKIIKDTAI